MQIVRKSCHRCSLSYLTLQILLGMLVFARISIWAKPRFEEAIAESFAESLWVERYLIGVLVADRVVPESTVAVMLDNLEVALPSPPTPTPPIQPPLIPPPPSPPTGIISSDTSTSSPTKSPNPPPPSPHPLPSSAARRRIRRCNIALRPLFRRFSSSPLFTTSTRATSATWFRNLPAHRPTNVFKRLRRRRSTRLSRLAPVSSASDLHPSRSLVTALLPC